MTAAARALPEGRYGKPSRRPGRRTVLVLAVCGVLAGGVVAWLGYRNLGSAPIEAERVGFASEAGNRMKLTFDVTRSTPERPAVCVVRVRDAHGQESGRREVYVPPGAASTRMAAVITSGGEPVTADVFGCSYQVPSYLSTTQPPTG
ncbi:DUF4307 domain-containing protein [Actinokineospora auranticolor]|uniref:Uncharacterized protein DUF4307 n=1 Tax=Actinokineospora auranticolor TaxID=155976 RepID=A0A2S6GYN3_9PSEU|nr:DUF4307 domain-containing protein [Actinokineospora auranticolor]PPK70277.1 uncharacterized protein DUF4307 [Actinokineospora auranticolor]